MPPECLRVWSPVFLIMDNTAVRQGRVRASCGLQFYFSLQGAAVLLASPERSKRSGEGVFIAWVDAIADLKD